MKCIAEEPLVSIKKQSQLLGINRSNYYYKPVKGSIYYDYLIKLEIDKIYTELPFYGHRKVQLELESNNFSIGKDKVLKLMKDMGIKTQYPKMHTTIRNKEHKVYPYLLKDLTMELPRKNGVLLSYFL